MLSLAKACCPRDAPSTGGGSRDSHAKHERAKAGPKRVTLYATKSWDYGILRFSVNGNPAAKDYDAYSKQSMASGPIDVGVFEPKDGQMVLRVEVVGANPAARGTKSFFGLDAVVLSEP